MTKSMTTKIAGITTGAKAPAGEPQAPAFDGTVPSRLKPEAGEVVLGQNMVGKVDANGILHIRMDMNARLGRTKKGFGPNVTVAGTAGPVSVSMDTKLTLTAYQLAGFPDESGR